MYKFTLFFVTLLLLLACSKQEPSLSNDFNQLPSKYSGIGHEAYIVEFLGEPGTTQVLINYANKACGAGVAWATGVNLGLEISWENEFTLMIKKPKKLVLLLNPSGKVLQCNKQFVHIAVVPFVKVDA